jgi:hypothetical protein
VIVKGPDEKEESDEGEPGSTEENVRPADEKEINPLHKSPFSEPL